MVASFLIILFIPLREQSFSDLEGDFLHGKYTPEISINIRSSLLNKYVVLNPALNSNSYIYRVSQKTRELTHVYQIVFDPCSIFFMNLIIAVFQFKHLISKTPVLEIFKMWSTIFVFSKLTEILQNIYKFKFI